MGNYISHSMLSSEYIGKVYLILRSLARIIYDESTYKHYLYIRWDNEELGWCNIIEINQHIHIDATAVIR